MRVVLFILWMCCVASSFSSASAPPSISASSTAEGFIVASFGLLGRFNTTPEVWNVYPLGDTKPTLLQELCAWNFSGVPDNLRQVDALEKKDKICFHQFAYAFPDPENVAATVSCNSRNVL